jgi:eukaryotic-like serine/threonine-protein kinase
MNGERSLNADLEVGATLAGKYRVQGTLGVGGMGVVFAATHLSLDRQVAVKVVRADVYQHPEAVERLTREAKLAARFQGEHVCRVLDVGVLDSGAPYIVMEYLEGVDLAALLEQQGPLDVETAVDFMLQVCEALAEAHTSQIVHRDLKPENLFVARAVDGTPTIKVLDFGISKDLHVAEASRSLTNPSMALGSPHYMAPEQMRSARDVDVRVDIWAVGAILFELVTGRQAFPGATLPEVCASVLDPREVRVSELNPALSPELAAVLDRALAKDRAQRFQDVAELAVALAPFGSPAAQASRESVERALTGKELGAPRLSKDPTGRYVLGTGARSTSRVSVSPSRTGAVTASAVAPGARRRKLVVPLAVAAIACALGATLLVEKPSTAVSAVVPTSAEVALNRAAPVAVSPLAASVTQPSASVTQPAAPSAVVPPAQPLAPRRPVHVTPPRAPVASTPGAAPSASAARSRKSGLADAWDPASFGPRN